MADCSNCKENRNFVPYIAHESAMARQERTVKRLMALLVVVVVMWFATIGIFVWYLNLYDFESYEYTQDGEGVNIIGDQNGVDYHGTEDLTESESEIAESSSSQTN